MEIPDSIFSVYEEAVDALLVSSYTSKEALLYYEKTVVNSSEGLDEETTELVLLDTIRLRVYNKDKEWNAIAGVQLVDGRCRILGFSTDKAAIKKCTYLQIEGYNFKLSTEPMRHGFGDRYFSAIIDLLK